MFGRALTEASDVQQTDVTDRGGEGDSLVNTGHDVVKQATINRLSQRVPSARRFTRLQGHSEIVRFKKISLNKQDKMFCTTVLFSSPIYFVLYH